MPDPAAPVQPTPPQPASPMGNVVGHVASGSIASGFAILIRLEMNKHGHQIDEAEAWELVPLAILIVTPIGMLLNAMISRLIDWIKPT